jgi:hypothetical protein
VALQQLLLAHHPMGALAVDRRADLSGRERGDHPGAVGRVLARDRDDRLIDRTRDRPRARVGPASWGPVDRLAGDLHHTRHHRGLSPPGDQLAGPGDALSLPAPQCFPRYLQLIGLAPERALEFANALSELALALALLLARELLARAASLSRHE